MTFSKQFSRASESLTDECTIKDTVDTKLQNQMPFKRRINNLKAWS